MYHQRETIPYGIEVYDGEYICADCGFVIKIRQRRMLPPCPQFDSSHVRRCWCDVKSIPPTSDAARESSHGG